MLKFGMHILNIKVVPHAKFQLKMLNILSTYGHSHFYDRICIKCFFFLNIIFLNIIF